jgi:hypothetical protein
MLEGVPTASSAVLDYVPQAASIGRGMLLRAELAGAAGDRVTAQRFGRRLRLLWKRAESPMKEELARVLLVSSKR